MVSIFNFFTRPILPNGKVDGEPMVSVLIPARNEETNIARILKGVQEQSYSNIEVIVYDDVSIDNTAAIVNSFAEKYENIKLLKGEVLPSGWLGKNHACYQLALKAKGDYLLFLDADVEVSKWFVVNALAYVRRKNLILLSMFPRQRMMSCGESLVVPTMNWILLSLLPLRLVSWSKRRSFAAANGQMMMFEANSYRENHWHEKVKSSPVEDIDISRLLKRKRMRMATLLGTDDIACRMYTSYADAINGFTKNVSAFFGGSIVVAILFAVIGTVGPFLVFFSLPFPFTFLYFFSLIGSRIFISKLSEQSALLNVVLWPVQHFAFLHLVVKASYFAKRKQLEWKGRNVGR
jgi:glycosyltransferase involved in cell wall biosynthesis